MTGAPRLIPPDRAYKDSYADALEEGLGEIPATADEIAWIREDFDDWLRADNDMSRRIILADGREIPRVPFTTLWLVAGPRFLGRITLRHDIPPELALQGGHVGYAVRATARGQGYGQMMLEMARPVLRRLGINPALITCDDDNHASIRIIEKAGGKLQDTVDVAGAARPVRRYWLET
jgi:predicted acetyltransferase